MYAYLVEFPALDHQPLIVTTIVGSNRTGRFAPVVRDWFAGRLAGRQGLDHRVVDLADTPPPEALPGYGATLSEADIARLTALSPAIGAADAFVVITPEYNHSFPGVLKTAIDWHKAEWRAKPVGFISYGGISGGLRAVEQLRLVFAELHAVTMRDTVSFTNAAQGFGPDGLPVDADAATAATDRLLDQLSWWAITLREGKARRPYGQ